MELVFIRHGEGEHTLNIPDSLHISDPALTAKGRKQAAMLKTHLPLTEEDILVVSPLRRTLQTALHWSEGINCRKLVSPVVSPRKFPHVAEGKTLPCDEVLNKGKISEEFPGFQTVEDVPEELWIEGINLLPQRKFNFSAEKFLGWCREQENRKIYIVTHDGTITAFRQFNSGVKLSREDFPEETAWFCINIST